MVVLCTSEPEGLCYAETASLDGETNLKIKRASPDIYKQIDKDTLETIDDLNSVLKCEQPNKDLYNFDGTWRYNIPKGNHLFSIDIY